MKKQNNPSINAHLLRGAFFLLLFLAVCVIPFALAQRGIGKKSMAPQGTCPTPWSFIADMLIDEYGAACASDGTSIYCAGGYSFSFPGLVPQLIRYDPGTNSWTGLAPIPVPSSMASAVYYPPTNKIYVFGGSDPDAQTVNNLNQIYDIASNTWSTGTPLPDLRSFMASGYNTTNGKIYLVGGYNTAFVDSGQPDTWEYDPVTDSYTNKTDFPELAGGYASGIINGHLYVAGGRDVNNVSLSAVWDYDIAADTWTQKNDMPGTQNNVRGSAVALDSLFVFGGGNPFIVPGSPASKSKAAFPVKKLNAVAAAAKADHKIQIPATANNTNVYLPATDEWRTSANMNVFRAFTSGAAIGTNVYAAGGYDGTIGFTVASAEVLTACIPEPTPTPCPGDQYTITPGTDPIVPGDTDTGVHCDDCTMSVSLPFSFQLYDQSFTSVNIDSNGRLDFVIANEPGGYITSCLPAPPGPNGPYDYTIFGVWQDQLSDVEPGCASFPGGTCGVFTSVSGTAPNRIFNIEWRTVLFGDPTQMQNFEVRLYENDPLKKFDVVIGTLNTTNASQIYVSGVQGLGDLGFFTQDFCTFTPPSNVSSTYTSPGCGTPSPTPTATPSVTPTATPTTTPTPSVTPSATPTPTTTPTVTPTPTPAGCVFSQGYWKNHPEAWPVTELQLGNTTYTQDQLLAILREPVRGNGLLILAKQEIAAKLNIANGADGSCIQQTLADADALIGDLVIPPIGDGYLRPRDVSPTAGILGDYNEGNACAPSCDNSSPSPSPRPRPTPHARP
jgi:N-acetylneuraminic acid mutarotase